MNSMDHCVFNQDAFYEMFENDLKRASDLVVIQSPFLRMPRIRKMIRSFRLCGIRGVRVCVFAQKPQKADDSFTEAKQLLISSGVHVNLRPQIHEKLAVIDDRVLWEGSLNILSYWRSKERMTRWLSREKVREANGLHKIDQCLFCIENYSSLSRFVAHQRRSLGITQKELARRAGVSQYIISNYESGKSDVKVSTLSRICEALDSSLKCLPLYMVPSTDERLKRHEKMGSGTPYIV